MVFYKCECCTFETKLKSNYERHIKTKKHKMLSQSYPNVTPKLPFVTPKLPFVTPMLPLENKLYCKYCNQKFKYRSGLSRHIKYTCKKSKDEDLKELVKLMNEQLQEQNSEINNMKTEIEKRDKQITKLSNKLQIKNIKNIQNNIKNNIQNNNNNNIQNNQINIHLNNYKDTDLSLLNEQDYINCIKRCKNCVVQAIETIHFNPKFPQNMNLCISNIKENYMLMYEDYVWKLKDRNAALLRIYEDKEDILNDWVEEVRDINPNVRKLFDRYVNMKDNNDELIKELLKDVKIMMYNNKHKINSKEDLENLQKLAIVF